MWMRSEVMACSVCMFIVWWEQRASHVSHPNVYKRTLASSLLHLPMSGHAAQLKV